MFQKLFAFLLFMVAFVLSSSAWVSAQAASFDCRKARSVIEVLICADPILSGQDAEMAVLYKAQLSRSEGASKSLLLNEQRQFNKSRTSACPVPIVPDLSEAASNAIIECLKKHYAKRISHLSKYARSGTNQPVEYRKPVQNEKSQSVAHNEDVVEANTMEASACDHMPTKKKYFIATCSWFLARHYGHNDIAEKKSALGKDLQQKLACTNGEDKAIFRQASSSAIHIKSSKAISPLMDISDAIRVECSKASKDIEWLTP
jgi:uncharacterized protein